MAYLCVDRCGEYIANNKPIRLTFVWGEWKDEFYGESCILIPLPKGTIEKLIGKKMTWEDEPICLDEVMYHNGDIQL